MVYILILSINAYMYRTNVFKIGGNENYVKFSKRKDKLPLKWCKQGNYLVMPIYGVLIMRLGRSTVQTVMRYTSPLKLRRLTTIHIRNVAKAGKTPLQAY